MADHAALALVADELGIYRARRRGPATRRRGGKGPMTQGLTECIEDQFGRALGMYRTAAEAFPEEEWRRGDTPYQRPAGLALHIVETIEFYVSDQPAAEFLWGRRFGVHWEAIDSEKLPEQPPLLDYLAEVEEKLELWLAKVDLLAPEAAYPWTGGRVIGRAMYVLRHTQHHLSELSLEPTRRGYPAPEWR